MTDLSVGKGSMEPPKSVVEPDLQEITHTCYMATDGDTAEGAQMLVDHLEENYPEWYKRKARDVMLTYWAQDAIGKMRSRVRTQIASAPCGRQSITLQGLNSQSIKAVVRSWYDWCVVPGVLLRDARQEDIDKAVQKYQADANTFNARANWLVAVRGFLKDELTKVSDVLKESKLEKLAVEYGVAK